MMDDFDEILTLADAEAAIAQYRDELEEE